MPGDDPNERVTTDADERPSGAGSAGPTQQRGDDEVGPLEGLLDPEEGVSSPASDADAPAPPG